MTAVELNSVDEVYVPGLTRTVHGHARLAMIARRTCTVVVAILVVATICKHRQQLQAGLHLLNHLSWWLPIAAVAEAASMVSFALLQRRLLRAGRVEISTLDMAKISLAANAISGSLPGGAAWSASWSWRQLRQRGADRRLATWVVVASGVVSSLALFVMVIAGTELAGSHGPAAPLRWLVRALAALAVIVGILLVAIRSRCSRPPIAGRSAGLHDWLGAGHLTVGGWAMTVSLAMTNWLLDLVCLVVCIAAVGSGVDWRDIVVVYSLTQLIAALPLTPGGLGVVDAGLTALLISYGMSAACALATVVLYRALTFSILIPGGWVMWWRLDRRFASGVLASAARQPRAAKVGSGRLTLDSLLTPAPSAAMTIELVQVPVACAGTPDQAP